MFYAFDIRRRHKELNDIRELPLVGADKETD